MSHLGVVEDTLFVPMLGRIYASEHCPQIITLNTWKGGISRMKQRKTVEDYLKAVYLLQKQNGSVRGADIAAELHVSRPTVSVSLKELEKEGYLFLDGAREVHLTDKGQTVARETYERHQTFQSLLEDLGVDGKTAAEDACQMEHAVSPKSYEALRRWTNRKKASGCE